MTAPAEIREKTHEFTHARGAGLLKTSCKTCSGPAVAAHMLQPVDCSSCVAARRREVRMQARSRKWSS